MLRKIFIIIGIALTFTCSFAKEKSDGMKPRWMTSSLPVPESPGYIFIAAQGSGTNLDEASQRALVNLTTKLEHERGLEISSMLTVDSRATRNKGVRTSDSNQTYTMTCTEQGKRITLIMRVIDEYWERRDNDYVITQLFTVNDQNVSGTGSY